MKTAAIAFALAILAGLLPVAAVDAAARTLVLAVALMAAGIFPCMTLTVNAMKGEERSPAMVTELYDQLKKVLKILVVAFALAVSTVLLMAVTVACISSEVASEAVRALAAMTGLALGFFMSRVVAIGRTFFALLDINRTQALLISRKRVRSQRSDAIDESRKESFVQDDPTPRKLRKLG